MDVGLVLNMLFKDKREAKEAIDNCNIVNRYHLKFIKSDPNRI